MKSEGEDKAGSRQTKRTKHTVHDLLSNRKSLLKTVERNIKAFMWIVQSADLRGTGSAGTKDILLELRSTCIRLCEGACTVPENMIVSDLFLCS
jgi:hypothetical protein